MNRAIGRWLLRKISWRFGFVVLDIDEQINKYADDPREILYWKDLPFSLQYFPSFLGTGLRFYPLTSESYHPFVVALKGIIVSENPKELAFSVLKKYNQVCSLKNANDFLGLNEWERCFPTDSHPYEFTYPWNTASPIEVKEFIITTTRNENERYAFKSHEALDLPFASDEKIRIEVTRLLDLLTSIRTQGFKQQVKDYLGCFVLVSGEDWRWYVQGGQHRAAVLAALGFEKIPVSVRKIIRREDVDFWPQVQSGLFTRSQALLVFDRLFAAKPPPLVQEWVDYVNQTFYNKVEINA